MSDAVRAKRRDRTGRSAGLRQLPFGLVRNRYRPLDILGEDQIEAIHRASLRLLAEVGMRFCMRRAGKSFAGAGRRWRKPIAAYAATQH